MNRFARPMPLLRLLLPLLAVLAGLWATLPALAQEVEVVELAMGETKVIDVDFDIQDIILGNNSVADVALLSTRSLVVTPLAGGSSRVILRDAAGVQRRILSIIVSESYSQLQAIIDDIAPGAKISVRNVNGRAMVSGTVQDQAEANRILDIAKSYSQGDVIDGLKIGDPRQIMLKVNILELTRSGGKELGINLFSNPKGMEGTNGTPFGVVQGNLDFGIDGQQYNVDLLVQALETKGLAKRLANPTLVSVNASTASFVVGGEVPVVTTDKDGGTTTLYREYGVKLAFTPQVLANQTIRMQISPEVSEVDWTRRVNDNPAFISRKVDTTIELKSGTSFAIAGLLQRDSVRSVRQYPWMGDVPILGALFRSSAYQNNQTELVVVVTPYLVNESSPQNIDSDPTVKGGSPSDLDTFVLGAVDSDKEMVRRFKSGFGVTGAYGHILPTAP